jgi:hypothetical protein
VEGDELVLQPSGAAALFDPREPQIRQRLLDAAREVSGRTLALRVLPAAGPAAARPPSPAQGRAPGGGDLDQRILGDWPGSERVDF